MSETKINVSQTTITAEDIGAASAFDTMPTASATTVGKIVQYTGSTDSTYTNGFFYKGVSDGQDPATYSWVQTNVQPQAGGLPDQTGNEGKFLTTNGTNASWSNKPLVNTATGSSSAIGIGSVGIVNGYYSIGIGNNTSVKGQYAISIGPAGNSKGTASIKIGAGSESNADDAISIGRNTIVSSLCNSGIAIGCNASVSASNAIQISSQNYGNGTNVTNADSNTVKIANANGNFEIMSADGTMPAARHATLPAADGTYTLQLVITNGVPTLSWVNV